MKRLALLALLGPGCICGNLDGAYDELVRRADGGSVVLDGGERPDGGAPDGGSDAGPADDGGAPMPDGGSTDGGPPDAGMCAGDGVDCSGNPAVCCAGLCCSSNGTVTLCLPDPPTPPFLCVI